MNKIFTLLLTIFSLTITAQNATLKGVVKDEAGEPLFATNVVIDAAKGIATQSDFDGKYTLSVAPGKYFVLYSYIGKQNAIKEVNLAAGQVLELNITLNSKETELEIVTVTGGKYEKKLGEEVVSIEVLPANIVENNAAQADEALTKVPGYTKIGNNASIRGGSGYAGGASSRVMVLVDDMPSLSPENGAINFEALPIENLQQVEIIKGASSAMYGSSALNGIINFRTAWAKKDEPFRQVTVATGLYDRYDSKLIKTKKFDLRSKNIDDWRKTEKHIPMFGNISYEHRQKFKNVDLVLGAHYRNDQGFRKNNELQRVRINGKLRYVSEKILGLNFGLGWNVVWEEGANFFMWSGLDSLANIPSGTLVNFNADGTPNPPPGLPALDQRTTYLTRIVTLNPFVNFYDKKENKHSLKFRYYNGYNTNFGYEELITNHIYGEYSFFTEIKNLGLNIASGISGFYTNATGETFNNKVHTGTNVGAFVQVDKKFLNKITLSAGLRAEFNAIDNIIPKNEIPILSWMNNKKIVYSPIKPVMRVGLNYEATKGTFIRASYGEGFRVPTINELFVFTARGAVVKPNPNVLPERALSLELGVKQAVKVGKWQGYFDLAGFMTDYQNYIEFRPVSDGLGNVYFQAQNLKDLARVSGIEVSALGQGKLFGIPLNFLAGYTFTSPIDFEKKKNPTKFLYKQYILDYRNLHSFKADIEASYKNFTFGVASMYNSAMINVPDIQNAFHGISAYRAKNESDYLLFDIRLRYDIKEKIKISAIVKNLFNEEYTTRPGIIENPRYFTLQYQQSF